MRFRIFAATVVMLVGLASRGFAATVTLAWDANTESDLAGYRIEFGLRSAVYDRFVDVGKNTQWTIGDLKAGQTYYFVVRAYNDSGAYSDPSAEVSFTVPIVRRTGRLTYDPATGTWSSPVQDQYGNTPANQPGFSVYTGDFNGDGWQDLFLYNPITGAWLKAIDEQDGNYSFFGYTWAGGWSPTITDFDGDGRSDVFIYNPINGQWFVCRSNAGTDFHYTPGRWAGGWTIKTGDFNGDRRGDLFLYNARAANVDVNSGRWFRVLTQPDGSFGYIEGDVRWANDWDLTPADFNGDGQTDLFLYRPNGQWFKVSFTPTSATYAGGLWGTGWTIRAADFDGDRKSDLFLYNATTGRWFVALTLADGSFGFREGLWGPNWQIRVTDFNQDGRGDLLLYNLSTGVWFEVTTLQPGVFGYTTGVGGNSPGLLIAR